MSCHFIFFIATLLGSVEDCRRKSLPLVFFILLAAVLVPFVLLNQELPMLSRVFGGGIGLLFLGVSRLTKEAIGKGDAVMLALGGIAVGFMSLCLMLCVAMLLLEVIALVLLVTRRVKRKDRIPFFPFLAAGEGIVLSLMLF